MRLHVYSEIGPLRSVLVHAPGPEIDAMPPSLMQELLFDDILYGARAREEHRRFRAVMEAFGAEVLDIAGLLKEALENAPGAIPKLIADLDRIERLEPETVDALREMPPAELARALVEGLPAPPEEMEPDYLFRLRPLSNLLFTRDAQAVLGDSVVISAMSRRARQREPLLARFVFRHHPRFAGTPFLCDFLGGRARGLGGNVTPTIEGGDILVFAGGEGEGVIVVGLGERTMERAADRLAERLRGHPRFRTLILVPMPHARSTMHLDTIFTRISREECLVYAPMILPGGPETLSVIRVDLTRPDDWGVRRPSLMEALAEVGIRLEAVPCGGGESYIRQAREQWTDGANSFALAPGVVLLYARNEGTARELERRGYRVVSAADLEFDAGGRLDLTFEPGARYAVLVAGEELSRARGGPRCMTMPLARDEV